MQRPRREYPLTDQCVSATALAGTTQQRKVIPANGKLMSHLFTIPDRGFDGLQVLIDVDSERLQKLAAAVGNHGLTLNLNGLAKDLAKDIQFHSPERLQLAFTSVLMPLSELRSEFRMTPASFIDLLSKRIAEQNPDWHSKHKEQWATTATWVGTLIGPDSYFGLLQKAFRLAGRRALLATEIRILTELRPVYDDNVTTAKAMLLTSTLVIEYEDGAQSRTIHLTLGQSGLQNLKEQVNRADKKISVLEDTAGKIGAPVLVAGVEWSD
jgi:hypothetical protein